MARINIISIETPCLMNCVWRERQNPLTLGALRPFDQAINNKEAPQRTLWSETERGMGEHPEDVLVTRLPSRR